MYSEEAFRGVSCPLNCVTQPSRCSHRHRYTFRKSIVCGGFKHAILRRSIVRTKINPWGYFGRPSGNRMFRENAFTTKQYRCSCLHLDDLSQPFKTVMGLVSMYRECYLHRHSICNYLDLVESINPRPCPPPSLGNIHFCKTHPTKTSVHNVALRTRANLVEQVLRNYVHQ